jgi:uroporphyrinogen III methyltransferase/synthase
VSVPGPHAGPLAGYTVAITRAAEQAPDLVEGLARLGATVLVAPAIAIVDPPDWGPLDAALDALSAYDWLVVTSMNAWPRVEARRRARGLDPALFARAVERGMRVAAVGPRTAASLSTLGALTLVLPEAHRAEGLVAALGDEEWQGKRVFLPRALEARDVLPDALRARGAIVDVAPAYCAVASPAGVLPARDALAEGRLDAVVLTSGAVARAFVEALGPLRARLADTALVSIGPVTSDALRDLGLTPAAEARATTVPGLVAAVVEHFAGPIVADEARPEPGDTA